MGLLVRTPLPPLTAQRQPAARPHPARRDPPPPSPRPSPPSSPTPSSSRQPPQLTRPSITSAPSPRATDGAAQHELARNSNDVGKVAEAVRGGADVNEKDGMTFAPLHYAARAGSEAVSTKLLDLGVRRAPCRRRPARVPHPLRRPR